MKTERDFSDASISTLATAEMMLRGFYLVVGHPVVDTRTAAFIITLWLMWPLGVANKVYLKSSDLVRFLLDVLFYSELQLKIMEGPVVHLLKTVGGNREINICLFLILGCHHNWRGIKMHLT